MQGNVTRHNMA